jgi:plasmid maintenance system antidote protein VapI
MKEIEGITHEDAKNRFFELVKKCGFSPLGMETLLGYKSEGKYVIAIRNGNKLITTSFISKILKKFNFTAEEFKNIDSEFNESKISQTLSNFNRENYGTDISKFYETEHQTTSAIKQLIKEGFFATKKTTPEILSKIKELGLDYTSNDLSRDLSNIVTQKILRSKKVTKINKDGSLGKIKVNEYWVE